MWLINVYLHRHGDSIQCLAYDPTPTSTLVSCAVNDFGFYRPNKQKVDKTKVNSKINVCAWSKDGVHLALGLSNGIVTIRTQVKSSSPALLEL